MTGENGTNWDPNVHVKFNYLFPHHCMAIPTKWYHSTITTHVVACNSTASLSFFLSFSLYLSIRADIVIYLRKTFFLNVYFDFNLKKKYKWLRTSLHAKTNQVHRNAIRPNQLSSVEKFGLIQYHRTIQEQFYVMSYGNGFF